MLVVRNRSSWQVKHGYSMAKRASQEGGLRLPYQWARSHS